jgi:hypothetical protein
VDLHKLKFEFAVLCSTLSDVARPIPHSSCLQNNLRAGSYIIDMNHTRTGTTPHGALPFDWMLGAARWPHRADLLIPFNFLKIMNSTSK